MKSIVLSLLAVFLAISFAHTQVPSLSPNNGTVPAILNSSGGTFDNATSYFRYEWSLGESILTMSFAPADSSILVTQGVLQPCTDKIDKSPQTLVFENGDYKVFPNPTNGPFEVDFFVRLTGTMKLQLINAVGQVLETREYRYDGCCRVDLFDLTKYAAGVYYVVADLKPDQPPGGGGSVKTRHSGLKVIKLNP